MATYPTSGTLDSTAAIASGVQSVKTIVQTFDLSKLVSSVIANSDVINLMTIPAKTQVLAASLEVVTAGTQSGGGTSTSTLRIATTALTAALSNLATGVVSGGASGVLNSYMDAGDQTLNVLIAIATGTTTKNPVLKVKLVVVDNA